MVRRPRDEGDGGCCASILLPGRLRTPHRILRTGRVYLPRGPRSELPISAAALTGTLWTASPNEGLSEADTVVVCPPELLDSLQPWLQLRRQQGHRLHLVSDVRSADVIRRQIRLAAERGGLRTVVLVGDVAPNGPDVRPVPTHLARAVVNVGWGSEPEIATDNWYADLDDDGLPELAIGRLPAESKEELALLVRKIQRYEQQGAVGAWCRRVNLVAGVGGFGAITDALLETATRSLVTQGIPSEYRTSMTYASWRSPYCPDPRSFRQQTIKRLNEGCLLWVYIGHGRRHGLDWVRVPIGAAPILEREDIPDVRCVSGLPIAVLLSCYGAAFDDPEDCLGEQLLLQEAGPVAVLGGSRMTMPYGMAVLARALMKETFQSRRETLGEVLLEAKRQVGADSKPASGRTWLDLMARAVSPTADQLPEERREHVLLFNLLGDPLLRIRHPLPLQVKAPASVEPGQPLAIECDGGIPGQGVIELVCPAGSLTFTPEQRVSFDGTDSGMRTLDATYERALVDYYVRQPVQSEGAPFCATLLVPENIQGRCLVRVFLADRRNCAAGTAAVDVAPRLVVQPDSASDSPPAIVR